MIEPEFGYARAADGAYIAYATAGDGPIDLVWQQDWLSNVDVVWEDRVYRRVLPGFAEFARLIMHDRRATGLSSRNVPAPNLETRVADTLTVLDAVGSDRPVLGGEREGGAPNVLLAATHRDRARSLIWYAPTPRSTWAPDYPWGVGPEYVNLESAAMEHWGTARYGEGMIRQESSIDHEIREEDAHFLAKLSRHTTTPDVARDLARIWYETDTRSLLPSVKIPTLLIAFEGMGDEAATAAHVSTAIPDAHVSLLPGTEADGDIDLYLDAIRSFLGVDRAPDLDTILTTVLFTDIVDSTSLQARLGNRAWKDLIERHHAVVRGLIGSHRGQEQDTAGDGFYARFDGPARAIRCAQEIAASVRPLGIEIRSGLHTGECEIADGKCSGLPVSIGARVMAHAGPSEVVVSQTVKDLVAGSGLAFEDAGEHELKGVPDRWRLYRVV